MNANICPSCKTPAPQGAIFCDNCGFDLRIVSAANEKLKQQLDQVSVESNDVIICPNCRYGNIKGSLFCENCGTQLLQKPDDIKHPPDPIIQASDNLKQIESQESVLELAPKLSEIIPHVPGKLIIQSKNISISIPPGGQTLLIGREDPVSGIFPDIDLDPYGGHEAGVGRKHAQLTFRGGNVYIEDLDSVNGTAVNRQKLEPGKPRVLQFGDELRFGKMVIIFMKE